MKRLIHALALSLIWSSLLSAYEADGLRLEGGPFRPYSIARARLSRDGGLQGKLRILGISWEGQPRLLFEAELENYAESVDTAFYLDEEERAILVRLEGEDGFAQLEIPLVGREIESPSELSLRAKIRGLPLPFRDAYHRASTERLILAEDSLESAGRKAASELFTLPRPGPALPLLVSFALIASLLALLPEGKRRWSIYALLALAFGTSLALSPLLPDEALLYIASLPSADPGVSFSGLLEARVEQSGPAKRIGYGDSGEIDFVGIHAPPGRPLPLALLTDGGTRFHFDKSPLVRELEGELILETQGFILGWRLHEER